jgi:hypothetical protein
MRIAVVSLVVVLVACLALPPNQHCTGLLDVGQEVHTSLFVAARQSSYRPYSKYVPAIRDVAALPGCPARASQIRTCSHQGAWLIARRIDRVSVPRES